ncbi:MAG: hypothetical protein ACF8LK_08415 [Phycisphaerales bacterium JB041]
MTEPPHETNAEAGDESNNDRSQEFERELARRFGGRITRLLLSGLGGLIPGLGGFAGGAAGAWSEGEQDRIDEILRTWLKLHEDEIQEIGTTLGEVLVRLNLIDEEVQRRVQSREFLSLVRKAMRDWSAAESEEKRVLIRNLLANAGACRLCSDDVIRLFIEWIAKYSEAHFKIIRTVYKHPSSSRARIWGLIHGEQVREDSAEADLFKLLIHDLSVGRVIRQERATDGAGNFYRESQRGKRRGRASPYLKSAFDDEKPYVLTQLGEQFVHYTMNEIVPRLEQAPAAVGSRPDGQQE